MVAVATADRLITVLDGETFKPLQSWKLSDGKIDTPLQIALAVSPKGDRVFTTTSESQGAVTVWDAKTGRKTASFIHLMPKEIPVKLLSLSATLEGKVETRWIGGDGGALLWSPPEGVDFLPPQNLWLVSARAIKVGDVRDEHGLQISEWEILHAFIKPAYKRCYTSESPIP